MKNAVRLIVPALCVVAAVGCKKEQRENTERGTATVTGAHVGVANEAALDRIVAARCVRESTCNNVGADKHYTSQSVCMQKIRSDMRDDLSSKDCPRGIDQKGLNDCLDAIKKEDCNNPIDMIGRLAACRTSELCMKSETR
jgi:hypothetical protein